jgi:hypothetical protein
MPYLIAAEPIVRTVTVTARRAVKDDADEWTTVEIQAEATIASPGRWREEANRLADEVAALVDARAAQCAAPHCASQSLPTHSTMRPVDLFWTTVYRAGGTQGEGRQLVEAARGDFRRALALAKNKWNGATRDAA